MRHRYEQPQHITPLFSDKTAILWRPNGVILRGLYHPTDPPRPKPRGAEGLLPDEFSLSAPGVGRPSGAVGYTIHNSLWWAVVDGVFLSHLLVQTAHL